ncbi:MAG: hypothetical protein ACI841_001298 [Planctomycetota bacterium]|jgi:hypothetical protein
MRKNLKWIGLLSLVAIGCSEVLTEADHAKLASIQGDPIDSAPAAPVAVASVPGGEDTLASTQTNPDAALTDLAYLSDETTDVVVTPLNGEGESAKAEEVVIGGLDTLDPKMAAALPKLGMHAPSGDENLLEKDMLNFSDLALGDDAVNQLLDSLMALDDFPTEDFEFPDRIKAIDGEEISILGYMIPTRWEGAKVQSFMLVGDLLSCCFGNSPQADQWMDVSLEGDGVKYLPYVPIIVTGTFGITNEMPESGYFIGVYSMEATEVETQD